jgi:predicted heme/steroid binding protein
MNRDELANYDGRDGNKAYVAVANVIYDVTESPKWSEGNHLDAHQAGADLTEELKGAPHVRSVIERFPVAGRLEEVVAQTTGKKPLWLIPVVVTIALGLFFLTR